MSFYRNLEQYRDFDFEGFFSKVTPQDIQRILSKDKLGELDFLALLSEPAAEYLEHMAQKARQLTIQYFGRTIQLYIPLYISNFCTNECLYCGFNRVNGIDRKKLSIEEIEAEAQAIARSGMQHLLLLTGEAKGVTPLDYLEAAVKVLKRYFASVSIEMFPMDEPDYQSLKRAGVDGLIIYQEVYNEQIYDKVHLAGKKTDYRYRLDAPERGARAGFRSVNIGALLGLGEKRSEIFLAGLHAKYLHDLFLETEVGLSLPRINPAEGSFQSKDMVDDQSFVQFLTALRLFLPRCGIAISTRERAAFRDHLIHLGPTRFSAGSCTGVGGYIEDGQKSTPQFEITDDRSVDEIVAAIREQGYQPVYKDWDLIQ